ncbi:MAG: protein kinase [Planctomycetota bacterium]
MTTQAIHPNVSDLRAYGLGQLPSDRATVIERHLNECDSCCETVADLSSGDKFIELLQEAEQLSFEHFLDQPKTLHNRSSSMLDIPSPLAEHPRYEIVGLIGRGGMGIVYEARHRKMERTVALKVINREYVRKFEAVDRFHREVKTAAQLSHANIITAHDADNAGDYHFMVMEYIDGVDFSRIVSDRGSLSVPEACKYIRQAALGLQYAHEQGMVHRDIKPHNLMLTAAGTVKILDFGLASLAPEVKPQEGFGDIRNELTTAGVIMGTPDFISPEQAKDARQADVRSDIYSLGATLYHLLAGFPPFADVSVMEKLDRHAHTAPAPLDSLRYDIPSGLNLIVMKMMAKDPDDRFQTAADIAVALESCPLSAPLSKTPTAPPAQPSRRRSRFFTVATLASLFITSLLAGTVFYLQTGDGTIRVALKDESLEATVSGETIEIEDGDRAYAISPGRQQLVIRQKGSDHEFVTDEFRVHRNEAISFEVSLIAGEVIVHKDGEHFDSKQGGWAPARSDEPSGQDNGDPTRRSFLEVDETFVQATGNVVAVKSEERPRPVTSPVPGILRDLNKNMSAGTRVKQGEVLLEIEPDRASLDAQLKTRARHLETKLANERSKAETYGAKIADLEASSDAALDSIDQEIKAAGEKLDSKERIHGKYAVEKGKVQLERGRKEPRVEIDQQAKESEQQWILLAYKAEAAEQDATAARVQWEVKKSERRARQREYAVKIDYARAMQQSSLDRVATIQKELQEVDFGPHEFESLAIKAPCNGTLQRVRHLEKGQAMREGDELFTIVPEVSGFAVELWVSGDDIPFVQRGDHVRLQFEGWPVVQLDDRESAAVGTFGGELTAIAPSDDGDGNFRVIVRPVRSGTWPDERYLRQGVRANGWIFTQSSNN